MTTRALGGRVFAFPEYEGRVLERYDSPDLEAQVLNLADPAAALETLHWGRNYLYRAQLETPEGLIPVAVKLFRHEGGLRARLRRDKARASWRMARAFQEAGLPTAEPVLIGWSTKPKGPSIFVTRYLPKVVEARYLFRAVHEGRLSEDFPEVDFEAFLERLGAVLRRMHEAGFWHRDMSIGNVLMRRDPSDPKAPGNGELFLIDLNRARQRRRLTLSERTRDLCRLSILEEEHQDRFLRAYWQEELGPFRRWLYHRYQRGFLRKVETKKKLRGGLAGIREIFKVRRAHAHIPPAPVGAGARDKIVWDPLSDQPHQHASRFEKAAVRFKDLGRHGGTVLTVGRALPGIWRRYKKLQRGLYAQPRPFPRLGVGLRPYGEDPAELLLALNALGVRDVLLRLHPWQQEHSEELELARELWGREYALAYSLPQNRELVKDPRRWRRSIEEIAEAFLPYGKHFQVGQAINRSKWGVWNYDEYTRLFQEAAQVLRQDPEARLLGPSVIDFEYHATAALLNRKAPDLAFDAVAALLYVDRRGAPENQQSGFDAVDKVVLLRAIAETSKNSSETCWITEFNWPLWEGPHSPAGKDVSVDEESQANYLVRYVLLAAATGFVERMYWWQAVARGYGLMAPQEGVGLRRRPAFHALAALNRQLGGSMFLSREEVPPSAYLYRFQAADGGILWVGWTLKGEADVDLPEPVYRALDRDGKEVSGVTRQSPVSSWRLGPAPVYFYPVGS